MAAGTERQPVEIDVRGGYRLAMHALLHSTFPVRLPRRVRRHLPVDAAWRRWSAAWLGGCVLGVANGVAREKLYAGRVGERTAHQLSTATAIALFAGYFRLLEQRWPIPTARSAAAIGATWVCLTTAFEFGFGLLVAGQSPSALLEDYDLTTGHLWLLVLVWLGAGPTAMRRLAAGSRRGVAHGALA